MMKFFQIITGIVFTLFLGLNTSMVLCAQGAPNAVPAKKPLNGRHYLTVKAKPNEDAAELLTRFCLFDYECNVEEFFRLNKLQEDYRLRPGQEYFLPILIDRYNGKSIRSTLGINDWKTAKRIESFNRKMQETGIRNDDFVSSRELWTPWHELECESDKPAAPPQTPPRTAAASAAPKRSATASLPAASGGELSTGRGSRNYPIFGPRYANVPLVSQRLKGRVFYIVSGHGGPDTGAQGKRAGNTLCEDEYAYDVALRLMRMLISHGATAYMIVRDPNDGIRDDAYLRHDTDEQVWGGLPIPRNQKERLLQRCEIINELTARHLTAGLQNQTMVEIHVDSRHSSAKTDVFFYFRPGSQASERLADHVHQTFLEKYRRIRGQNSYNGTVSSRGLLMLTETTTPKAIYIELGNIRNDWDQQRLVLKNNRQALANWLCDALMTGG